jgi:hypothetical protein
MLSSKNSAQLIGQRLEKGWRQLECSPGKPDGPWGAALRGERMDLRYRYVALAEQYRFPSGKAVKILRQMGLGFMNVESDHDSNLN